MKKDVYAYAMYEIVYVAQALQDFERICFARRLLTLICHLPLLVIRYY